MVETVRTTVQTGSRVSGWEDVAHDRRLSNVDGVRCFATGQVVFGSESFRGLNPDCRLLADFTLWLPSGERNPNPFLLRRHVDYEVSAGNVVRLLSEVDCSVETGRERVRGGIRKRDRREGIPKVGSSEGVIYCTRV